MNGVNILLKGRHKDNYGYLKISVRKNNKTYVKSLKIKVLKSDFNPKTQRIRKSCTEYTKINKIFLGGSKHVYYIIINISLFTKRIGTTVKYRTNILSIDYSLIYSKCISSQKNRLYFCSAEIAYFCCDQFCNIYQLILCLSVRFMKNSIFMNHSKCVLCNVSIPYTQN